MVPSNFDLVSKTLLTVITHGIRFGFSSATPQQVPYFGCWSAWPFRSIHQPTIVISCFLYSFVHFTSSSLHDNLCHLLCETYQLIRCIQRNKIYIKCTESIVKVGTYKNTEPSFSALQFDRSRSIRPKPCEVDHNHSIQVIALCGHLAKVISLYCHTPRWYISPSSCLLYLASSITSR